MIRHFLRYTTNQLNRKTNEVFSFARYAAIDTKLHFYSVLLSQYQSRHLNNHVSSVAPISSSYSYSSLATASKSTLKENQQSLKEFPPNVQIIITLLQDRFDRYCNVDDDGLFVLYDKETTEQMWKATMKRVSKLNPISDSARSLSSNDDTASKVMSKQAGVLVLFILEKNQNDKNEVLSIVLTRRSKHLSSHASQISFPGGHYDETTDGTIIDTAMREAVEELYNDNNHHHSTEDAVVYNTTDEEFRKNTYIFGCTTAVPSLRGIPVTSVLGFYNRSHLSSSSDGPITQLWPGNPSEVELVFTVPITTLIKGQTTGDMTEIKRAATMKESNSPQYPTSHGTIWGLTAYILQPIVDKMLRPIVEDKTSE